MKSSDSNKNKKVNHMLKKYLCIPILFSTAMNVMAHEQTTPQVPADHFDMSHWKITLPMDKDKNGKVDEITGVALLSYSNPNFFYLDKDNNLVFQVLNKAITTSGSSNARSELRQMNRGINYDIDVKAPANNFSLKVNPKANQFGSIGGKLEATLAVNHVSIHSKYPSKYPSYSLVVGQIHANKNSAEIKAKTGFGYGNEPIKIFYKKWPSQKTGSVFWTNERNLTKNDPNRIDVVYPVWGNTWENKNDPKESGIALGEKFSYTIDVYGNMAYLTFSTKKHKTVKYQIDLSSNVNAYGKVDTKNNPHGYAGDSLYFKAGVYGQCSVKGGKGFWSTGCAGTGNFATDIKNGDYNKATFSKIKLSAGTPPNN